MKDASPHTNHAIVAAQISDASNQLYRSDIMSAYELSHGFAKPIGDSFIITPEDIVDAQKTLDSKRRLIRILSPSPPATNHFMEAI